MSGWALVKSFLRFLVEPRPLVWRVMFALAVVAAVVALRYLSTFALREFTPFLFQIPALLMVALVSGPWIGLLALALMVAANASLIPQAAWLDVAANPGPFITLSSFTLNGLGLCFIAALLRASLDRLRNTRASLEASAGERETTLATLEALLAHAPIGFAFFDRERRHIRVNDVLARMAGVPGSALIGHTLPEVITGFEKVDERIAEVFATGEVIADEEVEGETPAAPGQLRSWIVSFFPVRGQDGAIAFVGATVVEITERKKTMRALGDSERRYRSFAEALPKMVWTSTPDGTGDFYNRRWSDYTGAVSQEGKVQEWYTFLHPDEHDTTVAAWQESLKSGEQFSRECRFRAADGSFRWFLCRALPVRDDEGRIERWYGSCTDISEIVAAREALARSNEDLERLAAARTAQLAEANIRLKQEMEERLRAETQLRQAQKMEAVGQLTGGIAHDFNNLLTVVIGNLEAVERRVPEDAAEIRRFLDYGRQGALKAASLTQSLLAFARQQPIDPRPTDINALVSGMTRLLSSALNERITLETVLSPGVWKGEVDQNLLENAILNLAVNARDAMPAGGKLTIETSNARLDATYAAENEDLVAGDYVLICVSDTGGGMSPEVQARVFEPFFTTKGPKEGTGLGLSQVYGFVKQSGGHVKIYSEAGKGTVVKLYLPRLVGEEDSVAPEAPIVPALAGTILLVEDDARLRRLAAHTLRAEGHVVREAADAAAALALVDSGSRPDVLVTDLNLGDGVGGRELARRLHQRLPQLKTLYTTAYARNAAVHQAGLEAEAQVLEKPFAQADLVRRVKDMLEGEPRRRGPALLVEDEPFVALAARQILEDHGFEVAGVTHGAAALAHLRSALNGATAVPVLAVVDVGLPDISGDDLVRELMALAPELPVIIATGYGTETVERAFAGQPHIAFLDKPYDGATLRAALLRLGFAVEEEEA